MIVFWTALNSCIWDLGRGGGVKLSSLEFGMFGQTQEVRKKVQMLMLIYKMIIFS